MRNTSSIKIFTVLTLCAGLIAGGSTAQAKRGLIYTYKPGIAHLFLHGSGASFIDISATGDDPTTLTFKTKKKKGETVVVWFNYQCMWQNTNDYKAIHVRIEVDGKIKGPQTLEQCPSVGAESGSVVSHVVHNQFPLKLQKGNHTLRVQVAPVGQINVGAKLFVMDVTVVVLMQ